MNEIELTIHQRHERLLKIVRKTYQAENNGARIFENTSGMAWQGEIKTISGRTAILSAHPVFFGIPSPKMKGAGADSGGADLIGETLINEIPVFTAIEIKTGKSRLRENQKIFKNWVKSINGIYFVARECSKCWDTWEPIYKSNRIVGWAIPECDMCHGKGYIEE